MSLPNDDPAIALAIADHERRNDYWQGGKKGLWVSDGLRKGKWTPQELVRLALAYHFGWIATQAEETTPNEAYDLRAAGRAAGLKIGVWEAEVDYNSVASTSRGFDFYIGQVEGPGQYERLVANKPPLIPHAIVTNFGGVDTAKKADWFIEDGYYCLTESHAGETGGQPASVPASQVDYACRVLGWPRHMVSPIVGLGGGATLADYPGVEQFPGCSVFSAEYLF